MQNPQAKHAGHFCRVGCDAAYLRHATAPAVQAAGGVQAVSAAPASAAKPAGADDAVLDVVMLVDE